MAIGVDFEPVRAKIDGISQGLRVMLTHATSELEDTPKKPTFGSVAVIGAAGQVGELFTRTLARTPVSVDAVVRVHRWLDERYHPEIRFHTSIGAMLDTEPEVVILATPNPAKEALEEIAQHIKRPFTLVLPQNGVNVVPTAEAVFADSRDQVRIVRASLFTNVSRGETGNLIYNPKKNRIALSSVDGEKDSLQKTENTFEGAGFDVQVMPDYRAMEWTKLIANLWVSSTTATGLSPRETLNDRKFFQLELKGLKDRIAAIRADGIAFADIKWVTQLRLLARLPGVVSWIAPLRSYIADQTASARNNQPSAAAREIENGARRVEPTIFYHGRMYEQAEKHNLEDPVDMVIHDVLTRHQFGKAKEGEGFDLTNLTVSDRRKLLLEVFDLATKDLLIKGWPLVRFFVEGLHRLKTRSLEIKGQGNLEPVVKSLRNGRSVLVTPNHRSHADHVTLIKALQDSLPEDLAQNIPIYIVAGMKFDKETISGISNHAYSHPVVCTLEPGDSLEKRWKAQIINKRGEKVIKKLLDSGPCILVVYLEGGRNKSENLGLQSPAEGSGKWLIDPHFDLNLPVVIKGTERMLAPGQQWPQEADLSVEFCEVIPTAEMRAQRVHSNKWDELFATRSMKAIASKLPASQRGGY